MMETCSSLRVACVQWLDSIGSAGRQPRHGNSDVKKDVRLHFFFLWP
jgi:hypothetical protein